jgi:hypothetical protein
MIVYAQSDRCVTCIGPEKKIYHKYDMIVYPKKTQISNTILETLKGWFSAKKSKDEEEFIPLDLYDMGVFCLQSYLEEYKRIMCEGNFQQGTNIIELVDSVDHVFNSLMSFTIRTQRFVSLIQEVPTKNNFRGVCEDFSIFNNFAIFFQIMLYRK